ncbi:MAG: cell division protein ZapA [Clostridia bacterium]|nr:cell division protein ZapA [Clostridia bacterium]
MEKRKMTLTVGGRAYTIVSADPPEYLKRVADYADRKLREARIAARLPSGQADALALLSMADELLKAQDENRRLRRQLREILQDGEGNT